MSILVIGGAGSISGNFAKTMRRMAQERGRLTVFDDKWGAFPTPAHRPHNLRLDTRLLQNTFGQYLPHRQSGTARMMTPILEKQT